MKVSSPVGEFPFDLDRLRLEGRQLTLEGRMGAWPARVEIRPADGLQLAQLVLPRVGAPVLGALVVRSLIRRVLR